MRLMAFVLLAFSLLCLCRVVMLAGAHVTEYNFVRALLQAAHQPGAQRGVHWCI